MAETLIDPEPSPATESAALLAHVVEALGGTERAGQVAMTKQVAAAIAKGEHLAVQAGTGTGKSLAYLVPAVLHAQHTDSTVVVSTATIALQRQLVERDLPRLADALEPHLPHRPTFAIQKGRSNYLCLDRLDAPDMEEPTLLDQGPSTFMEEQVKRVRQWARTTQTGDREELKPGVPDKVWRALSVSAQECLGATRCPFGEECFAERAREEARNVDVVVTNHALLAIDALAGNSVLAPHDVVIVDEAHELDGRITSVSTALISEGALKMAAKRASHLGAEGHDDALIDSAAAWSAYLATRAEGRWRELDDHSQSLLIGLRDELWTLRTTIKDAPEGEATNAPKTFAERQNLSNHLLELHDAIVRILTVFEESDPTKQADVVWLNADQRGSYSLAVAPLSVGGLLNTHLFADNTVILTSATLALGGNFNAMAATWGLAKGTWNGIDVGTPFNPARSGILYVATALPEPGRDGLSEATLEEIYQLIMAAGGRTLGLFSSKRAAQQAAEALRDRLPMTVYLQGEESIGTLVDEFTDDEESCLFGTLTLWQGVDVPGPALSQVIIDRIPFPRPDDPLLQARKEAADAEGRSGFMEVAATHAALLLAQGAGRLLRHITDRGVVSVLDPRLRTKRYGSYLLRSLPPFWSTTDPQVVRGALRRLNAPA